MTPNAVAKTHLSKPDLRIGQVSPHIEKLRSDIRHENRKIILLLLVAFGAGVALATYVNTQAKPSRIINVPAPYGNGS